MSDTNAKRIVKPIPFEGSPADKVKFLSAAVVSNGFVYCSGQIGAREDGSIVEGPIGGRVEQIMDNLDRVLKAHGSALKHAVKLNVYLVNYSDYEALNEVYVRRIPSPPPARTCVGVSALPRGTDVEIECIALLPPRAKL